MYTALKLLRLAFARRRISSGLIVARLQAEGNGTRQALIQACRKEDARDRTHLRPQQQRPQLMPLLRWRRSPRRRRGSEEVKYGEVQADCSNSTSQALPNIVAQIVRWRLERIQIEAWSTRKQSCQIYYVWLNAP
jgi:hypothetical protein